jgi:hypothetical protein
MDFFVCNIHFKFTLYFILTLVRYCYSTSVDCIVSVYICILAVPGHALLWLIPDATEAEVCRCLLLNPCPHLNLPCVFDGTYLLPCVSHISPITVLEMTERRR